MQSIIDVISLKIDKRLSWKAILNKKVCAYSSVDRTLAF